MTVAILCSSKIEYRSCKTGFLLFYCFTNIIRINSDVKSLNCQTVSSSYRTVSVNVSGKLSLFVKSCFLNGYFKSKRSISEVYFAVLVSITVENLDLCVCLCIGGACIGSCVSGCGCICACIYTCIGRNFFFVVFPSKVSFKYLRLTAYFKTRFRVCRVSLIGIVFTV